MRYSERAEIRDGWPKQQQLGNDALLQQNMLGLIWSESPAPDCSEAIAVIPQLRDAGICVVSGYGLSMESVSVELLLEGRQPVVICLFKAIDCYCIPLRWTKAIDAGQLLVVAPGSESVRRQTKSGVRNRNEFIATAASAVFMPYASRNCHDETIARKLDATHKPLFTIERMDAAALPIVGARRYNIDDIRRATVDSPLTE